jgi:hypothetical protein
MKYANISFLKNQTKMPKSHFQTIQIDTLKPFQDYLINEICMEMAYNDVMYGSMYQYSALCKNSKINLQRFQ